jgi:hypothetical protein
MWQMETEPSAPGVTVTGKLIDFNIMCPTAVIDMFGEMKVPTMTMDSPASTANAHSSEQIAHQLSQGSYSRLSRKNGGVQRYGE